MRPAASNALF